MLGAIFGEPMSTTTARMIVIPSLALLTLSIMVASSQLRGSPATSMIPVTARSQAQTNPKGWVST